MNLESICKCNSMERIKRHFTVRTRDEFVNIESEFPPHITVEPREDVGCVAVAWAVVALYENEEITIAKYIDQKLAYAVRDDFDNAARIFLENELSCMSVIYEVPSESMARTLLFNNTNKTEEWRNES